MRRLFGAPIQASDRNLVQKELPSQTSSADQPIDEIKTIVFTHQVNNENNQFEIKRIREQIEKDFKNGQKILLKFSADATKEDFLAIFNDEMRRLLLRGNQSAGKVFIDPISANNSNIRADMLDIIDPDLLRAQIFQGSEVVYVRSYRDLEEFKSKIINFQAYNTKKIILNKLAISDQDLPRYWQLLEEVRSVRSGSLERVVGGELDFEFKDLTCSIDDNTDLQELTNNLGKLGKSASSANLRIVNVSTERALEIIKAIKLLQPSISHFTIPLAINTQHLEPKTGEVAEHLRLQAIDGEIREMVQEAKSSGSPLFVAVDLVIKGVAPDKVFKLLPQDNILTINLSLKSFGLTNTSDLKDLKSFLSKQKVASLSLEISQDFGEDKIDDLVKFLNNLPDDKRIKDLKISCHNNCSSDLKKYLEQKLLTLNFSNITLPSGVAISRNGGNLTLEGIGNNDGLTTAIKCAGQLGRSNLNLVLRSAEGGMDYDQYLSACQRLSTITGSLAIDMQKPCILRMNSAISDQELSSNLQDIASGVTSKAGHKFPLGDIAQKVIVHIDRLCDAKLLALMVRRYNVDGVVIKIADLSDDNVDQKLEGINQLIKEAKLSRNSKVRFDIDLSKLSDDNALKVMDQGLNINIATLKLGAVNMNLVDSLARVLKSGADKSSTTINLDNFGDVDENCYYSLINALKSTECRIQKIDYTGNNAVKKDLAKILNHAIEGRKESAANQEHYSGYRVGDTSDLLLIIDQHIANPTVIGDYYIVDNFVVDGCDCQKFVNKVHNLRTDRAPEIIFVNGLVIKYDLTVPERIEAKEIIKNINYLSSRLGISQDNFVAKVKIGKVDQGVIENFITEFFDQSSPTKNLKLALDIDYENFMKLDLAKYQDLPLSFQVSPITSLEQGKQLEEKSMQLSENNKLSLLFSAPFDSSILNLKIKNVVELDFENVILDSVAIKFLAQFLRSSEAMNLKVVKLSNSEQTLCGADQKILGDALAHRNCGVEKVVIYKEQGNKIAPEVRLDFANKIRDRDRPSSRILFPEHQALLVLPLNQSTTL